MSLANRSACVVPSCTAQDRDSSPFLSMHKFPTEINTKTVWIKIIRDLKSEEDWEPKEWSMICSRHFSERFFLNTSGSKRLRHFAAPSENLVAYMEIDESTPTITSRKRLFSEEDDDDMPESSLKATSPPSRVDVTPKSRTRLRQEHSYTLSPGQSEVGLLKAELKKTKDLCKSLELKLERRDKSQKSLKDQLTELSISNSQLALLEKDFPQLLKTIISNESQAVCVKSKSAMVYDEHMKKFAATLHFYSPKAYNFVRSYLTLPHVSTLNSWMKSSDCGPGYNVDVLDRLGIARVNDKNNMMTDINFMIDEMSIKKLLVYDPAAHCYKGHIDYGDGELDIDITDLPLASNVLVAMICGLSGGWKVPLGYIFTDKVDSMIQKTFVDKGLFLLEEKGFNTHSLISDGNTANVSLFQLYGVLEGSPNNVDKMTYDSIVTSFPNPANPTKIMYAIYDVCHMIKLWRSTLETGDIILSNNKVISWKYVRLIYDLQSAECIRAGNKLGRLHIEFANHKMNVRLAVQTLSRSVANAIKFCDESLNLPEFKGSKETVSFMLLIDEVFDILNSRHPAQKYEKAPISKLRYDQRVEVLESFCTLVLEMKYTEIRRYKTGKETRVEKWLVNSSRKRCAIGMIVAIKSIATISKLLLFRIERPFSYILTYMFSQDHIELFFNKVRGKLGRNNNPTVIEFTNIMKRVWHHNLLKSNSTGNCVEQIQLGEVPGGLLPLQRKIKRPPVELEEIEDLEGIDIHALSHPKHSRFRQNCLAYISGYVCRAVGKKSKCEICSVALLDDPSDALDESLKKLILTKDLGGLFTPCKSVYKIVEVTEVMFSQLLALSGGKMSIPDIDRKVVQMVTKHFIGVPLFPHINRHFIDFNPFTSTSHLTKLIQDISLQFLKVRLHDYGKRYMTNLKISTRHTLNKVTLFKNQ